MVNYIVGKKTPVPWIRHGKDPNLVDESRNSFRGEKGEKGKAVADAGFALIKALDVFLNGDDIKHGSLIFMFSLFDFIFSFFCICLLAVQPSCFGGYIRLPGVFMIE